MIRPTTIQQTLEDLVIEQAISREALATRLRQHKMLATGLKGVQTERTISDIVNQTETGATFVDLMDLGLLVGSGGVLSHAPRAAQARWVVARVPARRPQASRGRQASSWPPARRAPPCTRRAAECSSAIASCGWEPCWPRVGGGSAGRRASPSSWPPRASPPCGAKSRTAISSCCRCRRAPRAPHGHPGPGLRPRRGEGQDDHGGRCSRSRRAHRRRQRASPVRAHHPVHRAHRAPARWNRALDL